MFKILDVITALLVVVFNLITALAGFVLLAISTLFSVLPLLIVIAVLLLIL